jgi:hypothetical protein
MAIRYQGQQVATFDQDWYDWYYHHILGYNEASQDMSALDVLSNNADVDTLANAVKLSKERRPKY